MNDRVLWFALLGVLLCPSWARPHQGAHQRLIRVDQSEASNGVTSATALSRARALLDSGAPNDALAAVEHARRSGAAHVDVLATRAEVWIALGEPERAELDLTALIDRGEKLAPAYGRRAALRAAAGRVRSARADWAMAFDIGPTPERALEWGKLSEELGDHAVAMDGYRHALRVLDGPVVLRLALMRLERERGDLGNALREVDALLRVRPEHALWHLTRAELLMEIGRPMMAASSCDQARFLAKRAFEVRATAQRQNTVERAHELCAPVDTQRNERGLVQ